MKDESRKLNKLRSGILFTSLRRVNTQFRHYSCDFHPEEPSILPVIPFA
jgi:hypothetical protein